MPVKNIRYRADVFCAIERSGGRWLVPVAFLAAQGRPYFGKCLPFPTPGKIRPGSQRKSNRGSFWKSGKFLILRDRGKGGQYERKNGGRHRSDRRGGGVSPRW